MKTPTFFALIIGTEILNQRRRDAHFDFVATALSNITSLSLMVKMLCCIASSFIVISCIVKFPYRYLLNISPFLFFNS